MEIRRANKQDISRLLDLLSQILEIHAKIRPDLFVPGTTKYTKEQLEIKIDNDDEPIFVAVIDNLVVGYAFCQIIAPTANMRQQKIFHLDDLCVDEKYRHQHIGQLLFDFVLREAKKRNCYEITLNSWPGNSAAVEFYKKMNMTTKSVVLEYILED